MPKSQIASMSEKLKEIWKDPVWSKVISTGIIVAIGAGYTIATKYYPKLPLASILSTSIPAWLFLLLLSLAIGLVVFFLKRYLSAAAKNKEECPDKELHKLAKDQKRNLPAFVAIEIRRIDNQPSSQDGPYIDFTFILFNKSVYSIFLEDLIEGWIRFNNCPLNGKRKMYSKVVNPYTVGLHQHFTIRQWLMQDDIRLISEKADTDIFQFDELKFAIRTAQGPPQPVSAYGSITKVGRLIL